MTRTAEELNGYFKAVNDKLKQGAPMSGNHNKYCSANNLENDSRKQKYATGGLVPEDCKMQSIRTLGEYIDSINAKYPENTRDAVNPKHYDLFPEYGIQVREVMKVLCDKLDKQGYSGFIASDYVQAMQYFMRWFEKNGVEDIEKGIWYMNKIKEQVKND